MPYQRPLTETFSRIDRWVYAGGFALTVLAGYINVTMLSFFAVPVSHMSGAVSRLGIDMGNREFQDAEVIIALILSFLLGAMLSGLMISSAILHYSWRYTAILAIEALVLLIAAMLVAHNDLIPLLLTAACCGMQNAMASSYRGMIVRTTHVTGIITDLGFMLGAFLSSRSLMPWKLLMLVLLALGYFMGGLLSAIVQHEMGRHALWGAALISIGILFVQGLLARRKDDLSLNSPIA
jgi:uncharacterized membrane protein YoaK (UPF0700 family)